MVNISAPLQGTPLLLLVSELLLLPPQLLAFPGQAFRLLTPFLWVNRGIPPDEDLQGCLLHVVTLPLHLAPPALFGSAPAPAAPAPCAPAPASAAPSPAAGVP